MRVFACVLAVFLALLFIGGYFSIAGKPILAHLDSALGTRSLMDLHHLVFFFVYRGTDELKTGVIRTDRGLKDFQEKPAGIDNKQHYRKLDEASGN